jgi:uncharacterized protein (DUF1697 family)
MTDLCAAFEAAGCANVRSYIQSGNVLFDAPDETVLSALRDAITALTSLTGNVFFRTLDDLNAIVEHHFFGDQIADRRLKLYVVFLAEQPAPLALPVVDAKERLELIAVRGREAYVVSRPKPNRMYGFPNAFVERHLGVAATSRNWNTVAKLVAMAQRERR